MFARMPKARALDLNAHCTVGGAVEKAAKQKLADFNSLLEANYKWLEELLQIVKQTFARYVTFYSNCLNVTMLRTDGWPRLF